MQRRSLSPFCWHQTPTFTFHWPTSKIGLPKLCYSHLWDDSTSFEQRDRHDRMMIWTFYEIFLSNLFCSELITGRNPVGKIVKKTVWRSAFLLIRTGKEFWTSYIPLDRSLHWFCIYFPFSWNKMVSNSTGTIATSDSPANSTIRTL